MALFADGEAFGTVVAALRGRSVSP